jgi:hypothetical protein
MTLRVLYPKIVVNKVREIVRAADKASKDQAERDSYCQREIGLTHRYLKKVGVTHRSPSNRVLELLGYEVVIRDKNTGEEEVVQMMHEEG